MLLYCSDALTTQNACSTSILTKQVQCIYNAVVYGCILCHVVHYMYIDTKFAFTLDPSGITFLHGEQKNLGINITACTRPFLSW